MDTGSKSVAANAVKTDSPGCLCIHINNLKNRDLTRRRPEFEPGFAGAEAAQFE